MTKWERALYLDAFRHGLLCARAGVFDRLEAAGMPLADVIRQVLAPDLTRDELNAVHGYAHEMLVALAAELTADLLEKL